MKKFGSFLISISTLILLLAIIISAVITIFIEPSVLTLILFLIVSLLSLVLVVWIFVVIAIYIKHVTSCERIDPAKRGIWITLIIIFSLFIFPVYWFLYIRTE